MGCYGMSCDAMGCHEMLWAAMGCCRQVSRSQKSASPPPPQPPPSAPLTKVLPFAFPKRGSQGPLHHGLHVLDLRVSGRSSRRRCTKADQQQQQQQHRSVRQHPAPQCSCGQSGSEGGPRQHRDASPDPQEGPQRDWNPPQRNLPLLYAPLGVGTAAPARRVRLWNTNTLCTDTTPPATCSVPAPCKQTDSQRALILGSLKNT